MVSKFCDCSACPLPVNYSSTSSRAFSNLRFTIDCLSKMQIHQFFLLLPLCVHLSLCTVIKSSSSSPSSSPSTTSFSPRSRVLGLPTCTDAQTSLILRVLQQVSQWSAWAARTTRNRRWDGEKEPDGSPYLPPDYPYDVFTTSFGHVDVRKSQSARFFVERRFAAVQGEVRKSGTGTGVKSLGLVRIECDDVGVECQDPFVPFYGSSEENFIVLVSLFSLVPLISLSLFYFLSAALSPCGPSLSTASKGTQYRRKRERTLN